MYYKRGGLRQRSMETKSAYYLHLQVDQWHTVVIIQVVFLNSCNLFLLILVTRIK